MVQWKDSGNIRVCAVHISLSFDFQKFTRRGGNDSQLRFEYLDYLSDMYESIIMRSIYKSKPQWFLFLLNMYNSITNSQAETARAAPSEWKLVQRRSLNLRQLESSRAGVGLLGAGTSGGGGEVGSRDGVAARLVGAGGDGLRSSQEETAIGRLGDGEGTAGVGAGAVSDSGQGAVAGDGLVALDAGLGGLTGAGSVESEVVAIWWAEMSDTVSLSHKQRSSGW